VNLRTASAVEQLRVNGVNHWLSKGPTNATHERNTSRTGSLLTNLGHVFFMHFPHK
jgi:hypothetical protein